MSALDLNHATLQLVITKLKTHQTTTQ